MYADVKRKLIFSFLLIAIAFTSFSSLYAETFRVAQCHVVELTEDASFAVTKKVGLNDALAVYIPEERLFLEGIEFKMEIPEDMVFVDNINPETGDILDEPAEHNAAEFAAMLAAGGYPDFASDNVTVTFDEDGRMVRAERSYTPWQ